jgi:poly(ADP-ribose) glycohydrolase ARH3
MTAAKLSVDHFTGCMLGLATGDALGAPHEGGPIERMLWRAIGKTRNGELRWTDDTQMSLDLAGSLLANGGLDLADLARRFAAGYAWHRGYGPGAAKVLKRIRNGMDWEVAATSVYPDGSLGNGAAMRAPVIALFYAHDLDAIRRVTAASSRITHAHPLGIEGAVLVAVATYALLHQMQNAEVFSLLHRHCSVQGLGPRLALAESMLGNDDAVAPARVVAKLGNGITAETSCVTALFAALRFRGSTYEEMLAFLIRCRGDVDTLAAMAGAMWGAANGAGKLPRMALERRDHIASAGEQLFRFHQSTLM